MENDNYTINLTASQIHTVIHALYNAPEGQHVPSVKFEDALSKEHIEETIRTILDQRWEQRADPFFPKTPWNDYVLKANKEIIKLDGDKEKQRDYICKCYFEMSKNDEFDKSNIVRWFNSQMQITGNTECVGMFNMSGLYPSTIKLTEVLGDIMNV